MGILYVIDLVRQWLGLLFQIITHTKSIINFGAQLPKTAETLLVRLRSQIATSNHSTHTRPDFEPGPHGKESESDPTAWGLRRFH
jgi:hypothetical protein